MYCNHCGCELNRTERFCPQCGAPLHEETSHISDDVLDNRGISLLSYMGPLAFVPYFAAKRSPFARFHSMRGLNLFILEVLYSILSNIVYFVSHRILIAFGFLVNIANAAGWAFLIYVSICGIIHVCRGEKAELPYMEWFRKFRIIKH